MKYMTGKQNDGDRDCAWNGGRRGNGGADRSGQGRSDRKPGCGIPDGSGGVSGWMIGIQMRVKIEHDRAWMKGYRDGRENSLPPITVTTERMLIRYRENPGL